MPQDDIPNMEDLDPQVEQRLFTIIQGISGQAPISHLAESLGVSRETYYTLQRKVMRAMREALTSEKAGRKKVESSEKKVLLEKEIQELRQEKERLQTQLNMAQRLLMAEDDPEDDPPSPKTKRRKKKGSQGNRYSRQEKLEILDDLNRETSVGQTQTLFCKVTGHSPATLSRWKSKKDQGTLKDKPSIPKTIPHKVSEEKRRKILDFHIHKKGTYSPEQIQKKMGLTESVNTIRRIIQGTYQVKWTAVNLCHSIDFMQMGPKKSTLGRLLCLQEAYSRFKPQWDLSTNWTSRKVEEFLENAWDVAGKPMFLKSDQGTEFTSLRFQDFLKNHKVIPIVSPPYRASYNGKEERSHRDIRKWTRPVEKIGSLRVMARILSEAIQDLNMERPMKTLDWATPMKTFTEGPRVKLNRDGYLEEVGELTEQLKEKKSPDKFYAQRRAVIIAAQGNGHLRISLNKKLCQPISA